MGADGDPISWWHYLAGRRHLAMHRARESLRMAGAMSVSGMGVSDKDRREYWTTQRTQAGWI